MSNFNATEKQRLLDYFRSFYYGGERVVAADCPQVMKAGLVEAGRLTEKGSEFCVTSYPDEPAVQRIQHIREEVIKRTTPRQRVLRGVLCSEFAEADRDVVGQVLQHFKRTTQTIPTQCWVRDW